MARIHLHPQNKTIEVEEGANLRDELVKNDIYVKSTCGGCASCGLCAVVVLEGEEYLNEFSFEERQLLGNVFHITKERLSCQTLVMGDIKIDLSAHKAPQQTKVIRRNKQQQDELKEQRMEETKAREPKQGGFRRPKAFKTEE